MSECKHEWIPLNDFEEECIICDEVRKRGGLSHGYSVYYDNENEP